MKKLHLLLTMLIVSMGCAFAQNEEDPWQEYKQLEYEYDNESMTATLIGQYRIDWNNPNTWIGKCVVPEYVEHDGKTYTVNAIGKDAFRYIKTWYAYLPSSITKVDATAFASNNYDFDFGDERVLICDTVNVPASSKWFSAKIVGNLTEYDNDYIDQGYMGPPDYIHAERIEGSNRPPQRIPHFLGPIKDLPINETTYALFEGDKLAPSIFKGENRFGGPNYTHFSNCMLVRNIEEIEFDQSVRDIPHLAFMRCRNLKSVVFPEEMDSIGYRSFQDCTSLQEVKWPNSLKYLGRQAFKNCYNLTQISLPASIHKIPEFAFARTGITQAPLHEGIDTIMSYAFFECKNLNKLELPNSLKSVGYCAFMSCPEMETTSWTINDNLKSISDYAFYGVFDNLKELTFPIHMDYVGTLPFGHKIRLDKVVIPWTIEYFSDVFDVVYLSDSGAIYCYSSTPPNYYVGNFVYFNFRENPVPFHIPKGSLDAYTEAYKTDIERGCIYFIESLDSGVYELEQEAFDASLPVEMISLTGVPMGTFPDLQTAEASVAPGIYICRQGSNVQKIAVK